MTSKHSRWIAPVLHSNQIAWIKITFRLPFYTDLRPEWRPSDSNRLATITPPCSKWFPLLQLNVFNAFAYILQHCHHRTICRIFKERYDCSNHTEPRKKRRNMYKIQSERQTTEKKTSTIETNTRWWYAPFDRCQIKFSIGISTLNCQKTRIGTVTRSIFYTSTLSIYLDFYLIFFSSNLSVRIFIFRWCIAV